MKSHVGKGIDIPSTVHLPDNSKYLIIAEWAANGGNLAEACRVLTFADYSGEGEESAEGLAARLSSNGVLAKRLYANAAQWKARDADGPDDWDRMADYYRAEIREKILHRLSSKAIGVIDRVLTRLLREANNPKFSVRGIGSEIRNLVNAQQLLFGRPTEITELTRSWIEQVSKIDDPVRLAEVIAEESGRASALAARYSVRGGVR